MISFGGGGSRSLSTSSSFVDPKQQPFLDFLRNSGQQVTAAMQPGAQQYAQSALPGIQQQTQGLTQNPFLSGLQQQAGGNPALVQQQTDALGASLTDFYQNQLQPGIGRQFGNIGARGGSRQAVAESLGAQGLSAQFAQGAAGFAQADAGRSLQAGAAGGGLLSQGIMGQGQAQQDLFNVGMSQYTGGYAPLQAYSQIVGPPTVLDKSRSTRKSLNIGGRLGA